MFLIIRKIYLLLYRTHVIVVFGRHGKMLFRLNAGEANVFEGTPECTGTSVTNDTEVIIV